MSQIETILSKMDGLAEEAVRLRRYFHSYAECRWTEFVTTAEIAAYLEKLGIPFVMGLEVIAPEAAMNRPSEEVLQKNMERARKHLSPDKRKYLERMNGYTGLMAVLRTERPGPVVALRFDIDANERTESGDETHLPCKLGFASQNEGAQHACGHDGHTTIGLLTARTLWENKDLLCGTIKILFQPAEEGVCGARAMTAKGLLDDVDYLFSGHLGLNANQKGMLYAGSYGMLSCGKFCAVFHGASAHSASAPHLGKNALLAAASATFALSSDARDGRGSSFINVGMIESGTTHNIIPEEAMIKFETRGATTEINQELQEKAIRKLKAAAALYDCTVEIIYQGSSDTSASDGELEDLVAETAERYGLFTDIRKNCLFSASEDIAVMMNAVQAHGGKACFSLWGMPLVAPHHHGSFDIDESVLLPTAKLVVASVLEKISVE